VRTLCNPPFTPVSCSPVAEGSIKELNDPSGNQVESVSPEVFSILCTTLLKHALNTTVMSEVLPAEEVMT